MKKEEMRRMILEIIKEVDYDIWKGFVPEYSDLSEEEIDDRMNSLFKILKRYKV